MGAHTPGPWEVVSRVYPNQCDSIFGPNDAPIANMIGDSEANARRLAAALLKFADAKKGAK